MSCVFCDIIVGKEPAEIVKRWNDAIAFVPLNPVVDGHVIVIPTTHVRDFTVNPVVSAKTMKAAAELAVAPSNIITSAGVEATQSVFHLNIHIVPRKENDKLALPWDSGRRRRAVKPDSEVEESVSD